MKYILFVLILVSIIGCSSTRKCDNQIKLMFPTKQIELIGPLYYYRIYKIDNLFYSCEIEKFGHTETIGLPVLKLQNENPS